MVGLGKALRLLNRCSTAMCVTPVAVLIRVSRSRVSRIGSKVATKTVAIPRSIPDIRKARLFSSPTLQPLHRTNRTAWLWVAWSRQMKARSLPVISSTRWRISSRRGTRRLRSNRAPLRSWAAMMRRLIRSRVKKLSLSLTLPMVARFKTTRTNSKITLQTFVRTRLLLRTCLAVQI